MSRMDKVALNQLTDELYAMPGVTSVIADCEWISAAFERRPTLSQVATTLSKVERVWGGNVSVKVSLTKNSLDIYYKGDR